MDRGKQVRWASRILGVILFLAFLLVMRAMAVHLERLASVRRGEPTPREAKPAREGDLPPGAVW